MYSEISAPDSPCLANLAAPPTIRSLDWPLVIPVIRWPPRTESGSSSPVRLSSFGLGSNRSMCDGPPDMNR